MRLSPMPVPPEIQTKALVVHEVIGTRKIMLKLIYIGIIGTLLILQPVFAKERLYNNPGLSITDDIGVKFFIPVGVSWNTHFDLVYTNNKSDFNTRRYSTFATTIGARKYNKFESNLRSFWDFDFTFALNRTSDEFANETNKQIAIFYGFEYELSKKFGIEGKFGASYSISKINRSNKVISRNITIPRHALAVNYYFY